MGYLGPLIGENPLLLSPVNFQAPTVLALEGGPPVKAGRGTYFPETTLPADVLKLSISLKFEVSCP